MHQTHIAHSLKILWVRKEMGIPAKSQNLTQRQTRKEKTLFVFIFPDEDIENDVILISGESQDFILEFKRNLFSFMCD